MNQLAVITFQCHSSSYFVQMHVIILFDCLGETDRVRSDDVVVVVVVDSLVVVGLVVRCCCRQRRCARSIRCFTVK